MAVYDANGYLVVDVGSSLPAGTNVIGHAIIDSGSTTAVTGNVTAVQPIGTNLHTVIDSGTVTTVSTVTAVTVVNASRTVGNAGATLDAAIGGAAPANAQWHTNAPATGSAAACSAKFLNASGAAISVKGGAGNLYGFAITNETAVVAYIEFFNTASAPTLGTTAVVFALKIAANATVIIPPSAIALMNFTTGIGFAVTTTENGSTTASVTGMIFYL